MRATDRKNAMADIETLVDGFRKFREQYYEKSPGLYRDLLSQGQNPRFAVVACSDSRVDPALVLRLEPGEIFAVRNVGALVPPYEADGRHHGTSAALEFAVEGLGVEHIIVIGHAHCGGVAAMIRGQEGGESGGRFITSWTDLLRQAHTRALADNPGLEGAALQAASERHAVRVSLENLATFPFVQEATAAGKLTAHGWYLNIFDGELETWNPATETFDRLV